MRGVPATVADSDIVTVTLMASSTLYVLLVPAFDVKLIETTVGEVVSMLTTSAADDVWVSVTPSIEVMAVERNLYRPGESSPVTQLHALVDESALHVEPVLVQVPVEELVSDVDDAVAYDNCTDAPGAAVPVNVSV
jgi:hypothetical protein